MADWTLSRGGQINGAGATDALFLKVFPGEIMQAYDRKKVFMDRHIVRTIDSGKSAQFPALGTAVASYHTPGTEILGQVINGNEKIIAIDSLLVSPVSIANIDDAMAHYDVRQPYAHQLGEALANKGDKQIAQVVILTARAAAVVTGGNGGSILTNANAAVDSAVLAAMIFSGAQTFDEKDVPDDGRQAGLKPAQYYLLTQDTKVMNQDWGGKGSYAAGNVSMLAGIELVKSNNIPSTNIAAAEAGVNAINTYHGDFTKTVAPLWHKSAAGTVKLLDLAVEKEYSVSRQATLVVAKYAMGHGGLRPDCAIEIALP